MMLNWARTTCGMMGRSPDFMNVTYAAWAAARQLPNRYRLQEKFSDFKTVDGVTLPTQEDIQFSQELQNGRTTLWDYDLKGLEIANNMGIDAKNFEVK